MTEAKKRTVRIRQAQTKAVLSANREPIAFYWDIGRRGVERQEATPTRQRGVY